MNDILWLQSPDINYDKSKTYVDIEYCLWLYDRYYYVPGRNSDLSLVPDFLSYYSLII